MEKSTKSLSTQSWLSCHIQKLLIGGVMSTCVVESVHSVRVALTQYDYDDTILKSRKHISHYHNISFIFKCFMANKIPNGGARYRGSTEPKCHQVTKILSFFFSRLDWNSLATVFACKSSSILLWAVHQQFHSSSYDPFIFEVHLSCYFEFVIYASLNRSPNLIKLLLSVSTNKLPNPHNDRQSNHSTSCCTCTHWDKNKEWLEQSLRIMSVMTLIHGDRAV